MKTNINQHCDIVISELQRFAEDILQLGDAILDNCLEEFEQRIGFNLPEDFKYILKKFNSLSLAGVKVYGVGKIFLEGSLDKIYFSELNTVSNSIPKEFLPFSPDGRGNHYCLDLSRLKDESCPVVFWQHDFYYSNKSEAETCNENFLDWIKEVMIEWTLDSYNYAGNKK